MASLYYISCFFIKPDVIVDAYRNPFLFFNLGLGLIMLISLARNWKPILYACGITEVLAGVASWTGFIRWSVSWSAGYDLLAQIFIAVFDLVSAVVLFHYCLDSD